MGTVHQTGELKRLETFFDGEGTGERDLLLREHVEQCCECARILNDNRSIASSVREMIICETSGADLSGVEEAVFKRIGKKERRSWIGGGVIALTKRIWIPATVGVTAALLLFVFFGPLSPHSQPSAVVYSLKADVSSVMILETPLSRQTVLWFDEGVLKDGQQGQLNRLDSFAVGLVSANRYTL